MLIIIAPCNYKDIIFILRYSLVIIKTVCRLKVHEPFGPLTLRIIPYVRYDAAYLKASHLYDLTVQ